MILHSITSKVHKLINFYHRGSSIYLKREKNKVIILIKFRKPRIIDIFLEQNRRLHENEQIK